MAMENNGGFTIVFFFVTIEWHLAFQKLEFFNMGRIDNHLCLIFEV